MVGQFELVETDLSRIKVAKSSDNFLLVQIAGGSFHPADHLHVFVVLERILAREGHSCVGTLFQFVQFERLLVDNRM